MTFIFLRLACAATAAWMLALTSAAAPAPAVEELLKKGEIYDQKHEAGEALKCYLAADKLEPKSPRILVRVARQYRHLMVSARTNEERLRLCRTALEYAKAATALAPNDAEAQLSVAITLGKMTPLLASKEQVQNSPRVKEAVDKTLRLDPRNDTAWHILGRWHRTLAEIGAVKRALAGAIYGGLPKGSIEEAAKSLERAMALAPARLMHPMELGRVYAQMGRTDDARRLLAKAVAMPSVEIEDAEMKARGRELLSKLR